MHQNEPPAPSAEPALAFAERWIQQRRLEGLRDKTAIGYVSILGRLAPALRTPLRGPSDLLCPGPTGGPWRNDSLWKALQRDCRELGLRPRGHHTFRATLITRLSEAGITDPLIDAITHRSRRGRDALRGYQRPRMAALLEALERVQVRPESARQGRFDFGGRR